MSKVSEELRALACDLTAVAVRSPVYSMISQPGCDVVAVAVDHICAMARVIELRDQLEEGK